MECVLCICMTLGRHTRAPRSDSAAAQMFGICEMFSEGTGLLEDG
jgi:hypothetical protein